MRHDDLVAGDANIAFHELVAIGHHIARYNLLTNSIPVEFRSKLSADALHSTILGRRWRKEVEVDSGSLNSREGEGVVGDADLARFLQFGDGSV